MTLLRFPLFRSFIIVKKLQKKNGILKPYLASARLISSAHIFNMNGDGEPPSKKVNGQKKIGTHNGPFHCDEALACFLLKLLPQYENASITRTRDAAVLDECDIVVDVGGVFDPSRHRYDHHQRDFKETMNSLNPSYPWTTKLSSAGLTYFHFGHEIIAKIIERPKENEETEMLFKKVYENFLEEIDAIDNGISQHDGDPRYLMTTNISSRVGHFNSKWNEKGKSQDVLFEDAMKLVGSEFLDKVKYYFDVWWPARTIVREAIESRAKVDSSGEIIQFTEGGCPWKEHLFALEEELLIKPSIKFALYPDDNGTWRVQCVPVRTGSFDSRIPLLEAWRGLRDNQLSEDSGIPDCVFVHASGFIGGNRTQEGALKMAQETLRKSSAN